MEHLIALKDINDTIKAGDRFEAPDLIYVAVGLAAVAEPAALMDRVASSPDATRQLAAESDMNAIVTQHLAEAEGAPVIPDRDPDVIQPRRRRGRQAP